MQIFAFNLLYRKKHKTKTQKKLPNKSLLKTQQSKDNRRSSLAKNIIRNTELCHLWNFYEVFYIFFKTFDTDLGYYFEEFNSISFIFATFA